jgi:hypothetical protein
MLINITAPKVSVVESGRNARSIAFKSKLQFSTCVSWSSNSTWAKVMKFYMNLFVSIWIFIPGGFVIVFRTTTSTYLLLELMPLNMSKLSIFISVKIHVTYTLHFLFFIRICDTWKEKRFGKHRKLAQTEYCTYDYVPYSAEDCTVFDRMCHMCVIIGTNMWQEWHIRPLNWTVRQMLVYVA